MQGRGTSADLSFQVMGGTYSADSAATSLMAFDERELAVADDGTFSFEYTAEPGAKTLIVRVIRRATVTPTCRHGSALFHLFPAHDDSKNSEPVNFSVTRAEGGASGFVTAVAAR